MYNNVTKRKYFIDTYKSPYFQYKNEINNPNFYHETPNAKSIEKSIEKELKELGKLAQNYPIQGTSADITIKFACVLFYREILKRNLLHTVKMVNIVHDEILVEAPEEIIEDIAILLKDCMEKAAEPFVRLFLWKLFQKSEIIGYIKPYLKILRKTIILDFLNKN